MTGPPSPIAQTVRADVAGLTAANDQLGSLQGLLTTTAKALEGVSGKMAEMKKLLVNLSNNSLSPETRKTYSDDFNNKVREINLSISDATYNGRSLLGTDENLGADVSAVRNESRGSCHDHRNSRRDADLRHRDQHRHGGRCHHRRRRLHARWRPSNDRTTGARHAR